MYQNHQKQEEKEGTSKKEQTQELSAAKKDQINIWTKKHWQGSHKQEKLIKKVHPKIYFKNSTSLLL
jgi:hypothetical protein